MQKCESCEDKPAEYNLDDRQLCVECYKREEKKATNKEPVKALAA